MIITAIMTTTLIEAARKAFEAARTIVDDHMPDLDSDLVREWDRGQLLIEAMITASAAALTEAQS